MRRLSSLLGLELILWLSGVLFLGVAGARLLSYHAFQAHPELFSTLKPLAGPRSTTPIWRLGIPRLQMSVAVLEGDDDNTLALGPGHSPSSAAIGGLGNAVIAGHRDMAFRDLRNVKKGDDIEVSGIKSYHFVVTGIRIVNPDDVSVLAPTQDSRLTIVTCYPFYFIGNAPKRFVVQARKVAST